MFFSRNLERVKTQVKANEEAQNQLTPQQKKDIKTMEELTKAGKRQRQLIANSSLIPKYRHVIQLFYNPVCPHCKRVIGLLKKYSELNKSTLVTYKNIVPKEATNYGLALTANSRQGEIPFALIDDTYIITGETAFMERLTTTIQMAEVMPPSQNKTTRLLLHK